LQLLTLRGGWFWASLRREVAAAASAGEAG